MKNQTLLKSIASWVGLVVAGALCADTAAQAQEPATNLVMMYIHQHWPYKYPYAARTGRWRITTGSRRA